MSTIVTTNIHLAKDVFAVHSVDATGNRGKNNADAYAVCNASSVKP